MYQEIPKDIPYYFGVCLHSQCPQADGCMRQRAYRTQLEQGWHVVRLLNPQRCAPGNECPYFRSTEPVRYARGFTGMQRKMYHEQYLTFMNLLQGHFGRCLYFDRRRGHIPLPPQEQQLVLEAARRAGVEGPLEFDQYEMGMYWKD